MGNISVYKENRCVFLVKEGMRRDFPACAVVKNPAANAGDMGSIPGPGRSRMPRSHQARVPQLLRPRAATTDARMRRAHALQQEKPPQ